MRPIVALRTAVAVTAAAFSASGGSAQQPDLQSLIAAYNAGRWEQAVRGLRPLADAGNMIAVAVLCDSAVAGQGQARSSVVAPRCYDAATARIPLAMGVVAQELLLTRRDEKTGLALATEAAGKEDRRSLRLLGIAHQYGMAGLTPDPSAAVPWYQRSAEKGDGRAMALLGMLYIDGIGTPVDEKKGVKLLAAAADRNDAEGLSVLAQLCQTGQHGVRQDASTAAQLYAQSAAQGHAVARFNLARMFAGGEGVAKNMEQASQLLDAGIASGDPRYADWSRLVKARFIMARLVPGSEQEVDAMLTQAAKSPHKDISEGAQASLQKVQQDRMYEAFSRAKQEFIRPPADTEFDKAIKTAAIAGGIAAVLLVVNHRDGESILDTQKRVSRNLEIGRCKATCPGDWSSMSHQVCENACN
jgi:TPR repeat protein